MSFFNVIQHKQMVESVIKIPQREQEKVNKNFSELIGRGNSSLSRFSQQMQTDISQLMSMKKQRSKSRIRGLSLSIKRQSQEMNCLAGDNMESNPQKQVDRHMSWKMVKFGETLMETAHTINQMCKSSNNNDKKINLSTSAKNYVNYQKKEAKMFKDTRKIIGERPQFKDCGKIKISQTNNSDLKDVTKRLEFSKQQESKYQILISAPKILTKQQTSFKRHPSCLSVTKSKLSNITERKFLRSSKKSSANKSNNQDKDCKDKLEIGSLFLRSENNKLSKKVSNLNKLSKFNNFEDNENNCGNLSAMIKKSMINSIIISEQGTNAHYQLGSQKQYQTKIRQKQTSLVNIKQNLPVNIKQNLPVKTKDQPPLELKNSEEIDSPLLRLKKRLQMNSIKSIYEKESIVSRSEYGIESQMRESAFQIQESLIVYRNLSENLIRVTQIQQISWEQEKIPALQLQEMLDGQDEKTSRIQGGKIEVSRYGKNNKLMQKDRGSGKYKRYLGVEKAIDYLVCVKQMDLKDFSLFAHQLRVYEQIEHSKNRLSEEAKGSILGLVKHSTEQSKHLILKQPFTHTLQKYITNLAVNQKRITRNTSSQKRINRLTANKSSEITMAHYQNNTYLKPEETSINQFCQKIMLKIQVLFSQLSKIGLALERHPIIEDFVMVFGQIKVQNFSFLYFSKQSPSQSSQLKQQQQRKYYLEKLRYQIMMLIQYNQYEDY